MFFKIGRPFYRAVWKKNVSSKEVKANEPLHEFMIAFSQNIAELVEHKLRKYKRQFFFPTQVLTCAYGICNGKEPNLRPLRV